MVQDALISVLPRQIARLMELFPSITSVKEEASRGAGSERRREV